MVRVENGSPFLAVDGNCSYWVGGVWAEDALSRDRPIRTGALTSSEAAALEQAVPPGEIPSVRYCRQVAGLSDASPRVIVDRRGAAQCDYEGLGFDAAWAAVAAVARTLWVRGAAIVDGDLRVSAVESSVPALGPAFYAWPLETPLSDLLLDPGKDGTNQFMAGVSRLVTDPESARRLRALREQYLADRDARPGLYVNWDGLTTTDGVSVATVYFRDAIPYENAQGLLSF